MNSLSLPCAAAANLDVRYVVTVSKMLAAMAPSAGLTSGTNSRRSMHLSRSGFPVNSKAQRGIGGKR